MERWLFGGFLLIAAVQDWRTKRVDVRVYLLFGGAALITIVWNVLNKGTLSGCGWKGCLGSISIGVGLLLLGHLSRGEIGTGDGCFFIVSGLLLNFWENLLLLSYGTLLCGLYSLCCIVRSRLYIEETVTKRVVPFLPFLIPPGVWLLAYRF